MSTTPHTYTRDVFSAHAESLSKLSARMVRGSEVLELGPASGYFTRILRRALDCKIDAIEIDPTMAEKAREHCRDLVIADLDHIDWAQTFAQRRYDAIIAADVLEHLRDPERALRHLRTRLKPGGKLYISLPNIAYAGMIFGLLEDDFRYRAEGLLDHTHLRFFTRTTLEEMLAKCGWGVRWRGEVGKDIYEAEFHTRLERWPQSLREFVMERPAQQAYQLLCECVPVSNAGLIPAAQIEHEIDAARPALFGARLMWAASSDAISFDDGAAAFGQIGRLGQSLIWETPRDARVLRLRLADRVGYLTIQRISITLPAAQISTISIAHCTLSDDVSANENALLLGSNESWLELPIGDYPAGTRVEVVCDWPMSSDFQVASAQLAKLRIDNESARDQLRADLASALAARDDFERKMLSHESLIGLRDRALGSANDHVAHLETLIAERTRLIELRDQELQAVNARADAAIAQEARALVQAQALAAQVAQRDAQHALDQQTQAQLHADANAQTLQIATLRSFRGWLRDRFARKS